MAILGMASVVRQRAVALLAVAAVVGIATLGRPAAAQQPSSPLAAIEEQVAREYPAVTHLPAGDLEPRLGTDDVVLLDVREPDEFAVSRLPGAVRVDPGLSERQFREKFAQRIAGKTVVVYCSVGVRSSKLALRVSGAARDLGAAGLVNLRGGIFGWANARRPLVTGGGGTDHVHPYSRGWSRYIDDQSRARYAPLPPAPQR